MPKPTRAEYRVLKSFDYVPKQSVVIAFKAGQLRSGLTADMIARGKSLGALEPVSTSKEPDNG
ncbi:hypothetical protein [Paracoccus aminophilus]|uniref:hypothetical protein n=1 Tax=Paracoccus aminophilus TaxID=34003 RepID=UPI0005A11F93|nr:hypothetical protein [Paracoccus aminophilus]